MIIDFEKLPLNTIEGFRGGEGLYYNRMFTDDANNIVYGILPPGSSSGCHVHEPGCEVLYVLKGEILFNIEGKEERVAAGKIHYCPTGCNHQMLNDTNETAEFFVVFVK